MKRKERRHLKENDLAQTLIAAREAIEQRKNLLTGTLLAVLLGAVVIGGIVVWQQEDDARAEQLLADAMVTFNARVIPPSTTPDAPGEVPAAATLGATGSYATEAAKLNAALPKLKAAADAYPSTEAGITARYHYASSLAELGKAETQARAGQLNEAIATWKALASSTDEDLPKDAILMELGKAYQASGNQDEARKAFTQIIDEHPTSPYSAEARA